MSWWFKRHPRLLSVECEKLSKNGNYNEIQRERYNLLVSHGEILIRGKKTTKHPILIIYPESTPYSLPIVVLLNELISKDEVIALSKKNSFEAMKSVLGKVRFYNFWHQNPDGSLCLLEQDNLETYGEFFSINDVINRTRDWIAGLETGKLPPDSPEVELFAHFRNIDNEREVLVPDSFFSKDQFQGEFYCSLMSHIYPIGGYVERRIYLGILLQGENNEGIRCVPIENDIGINLMPKGINEPLDILVKNEIVKKAVEEGNLLEGYWWDVGAYLIEPIQNVEGMALLIGKGEIEYGYQRMQKIMGNLLNGLPERVFLAIRFLNKRGEIQWQSFTLFKGDIVSPPIFGSNELADFKSIFENYSLKALRSTELTEKRHHLRNSGIAEHNVLKENGVTVIGCGALGGEIADTVSKAGVGKVSLIDNQLMAVDNSIRHILGIDKIGLAKVHAIQAHIMFHNPFVKVFSYPANIMTSDINIYFPENSVGISSIANDNVEGYLNEQAIINNKTVFYVRALRGGKVARIIRVIPGVDACFHCLSLYSDERNDIFTQIPADKNLPTITNECNNPIRPASAAELKLISSIASQLIIKHLQGEITNYNHWIWSSETIAGVDDNKLSANSLKPSIILPHKDCQYCQPIDKLKVEITEEALSFMINETQTNSNIETGGVLVGKLDNRKILIRSASGPGPKAKKHSRNFLKDKEYCQGFINSAYKQFGEHAVYLGEWHYHPNSNNNPSGTDLSSLKGIANSEGYLTENPVMIILSNAGELSVTIHPVSNPFYFVDYTILKN